MMRIVKEKRENIMFLNMMKSKTLKILKNILKLKEEGNWENKIILVEKEKPSKEILDKFLNKIEKKKTIF